ncbi:hypothetical protein N7G274_005722 [Stereocaulon virgatum]|uniref:Uncharacterized protein n=1 Tax=Stereocaulon virgatum TaxID=373712 RepID=A0ABR4A8B0_9LECA
MASPAPLFDFDIETHILQEVTLQRNKVVRDLSANEIDGTSIYEHFEMTLHHSRAPISISEQTERNPGNIMFIIALVSLRHQWLLQHLKHMCTWYRAAAIVRTMTTLPTWHYIIFGISDHKS